MTTAFQTSFLCRILLAFAALWRQSGICALLCRLDHAFPRWLSGSVVFRFFARDGAATRAWPGSVTSAAMGGLFNLPTALARWIYRPCRKVLEGSFFWRLLALLGQSTALLTGLFLLVLYGALLGLIQLLFYRRIPGDGTGETDCAEDGENTQKDF